MPFEAASLAAGSVQGRSLDIKRKIDPDSALAKDVEIYRRYEEKVMTKGKKVLNTLPEEMAFLPAMILDTPETNLNLLDSIAVYMYYRELDILPDPNQFKRFFFNNFLVGEDKERNELPLEDFACFYQALTEDGSQPAKLT